MYKKFVRLSGKQWEAKSLHEVQNPLHMLCEWNAEPFCRILVPLGTVDIHVHYLKFISAAHSSSAFMNIWQFSYSYWLELVTWQSLNGWWCIGCPCTMANNTVHACAMWEICHKITDRVFGKNEHRFLNRIRICLHIDLYWLSTSLCIYERHRYMYVLGWSSLQTAPADNAIACG